jgi:hypothetical protein
MANLKFAVSGGVPPYTYSGNMDGEILPSGSFYFSVVSDANGCEKAITGIVDECTGSSCNVAATLVPTHPLCAGDQTGSIVAIVSGGSGPYEYVWSNQGTGSELSGLSAGIYTVTVTDALDCEQISSTEIIAPPAIVIAAANIIQPNQGQSNGAVSVDISGGTGAYLFNWYRNGVLFAMGTEDLVGAPAGDYQLQVSDANACSAVFEVTLTETVGTQEVADKAFVEVYPNPASEKTVLTVAFATPRNLYLSLADPSGRIVRTWKENQVREQNFQIDLKGLPSATYQLRIVTGLETLVEKVVVVR